MARQQNQNPGSDRGLQAAQPSALSDDTETPEPTDDLAQAKQAAPALSPQEQIAALQAKIDALTTNQPATQEPQPGSSVRPNHGPIHSVTGAPIFNGARPTGRAG